MPDKLPPFWRIAQNQTSGQVGCSQHRQNCIQSKAVFLQIVVSCTKGISVDSLETVNQILTRVLPEALHSRLAYLSGPSFAAEVCNPPCDPELIAQSRCSQPYPQRPCVCSPIRWCPLMAALPCYALGSTCSRFREGPCCQ